MGFTADNQYLMKCSKIKSMKQTVFLKCFLTQKRVVAD